MTKFSSIILFSFLFIFISCSSDSSENSTPTVNQNYFNYTIDNNQVILSSWVASKSGNDISVVGYSNDGKTFKMKFNKFGDFGYANSYSNNDNNFPNRTSAFVFSSNYFTFNLVSIDETNKRIKVNFSGKVYDDKNFTDSNFSIVKGDFEITYSDIIPTVTDLGTFAKINGANWYSTNSSQNGGVYSGSNITLNELSDDAYVLSLIINHNNTNVGVYNFTPSSTANKIILSKYNVSLDEIVEYDCTGTLEIIEKNVGSQNTIISGTFDIIANNTGDNQNITISEGKFKKVYSNY